MSLCCLSTVPTAYAVCYDLGMSLEVSEPCTVHITSCTRNKTEHMQSSEVEETLATLDSGSRTHCNGSSENAVQIRGLQNDSSAMAMVAVAAKKVTRTR